MDLNLSDTINTIRKDSRAQRILELVVNIIVVVVFLGVVAWPLTTDILDTREQIDELSAVSSQLANKAQSIRTAEENVQAYENEFELLTEAMPLSPKQFDMLNQIQLAGDIEGVAVGQLTHQAGSGNTVEFNLVGSGKYDQIVNYVSRIEELPRLVQITNISLNNGGDNEEDNLENPTISFTITGTGYYYDDDVTLLDEGNVTNE